MNQLRAHQSYSVNALGKIQVNSGVSALLQPPVKKQDSQKKIRQTMTGQSVRSNSSQVQDAQHLNSTTVLRRTGNSSSKAAHGLARHQSTHGSRGKHMNHASMTNMVATKSAEKLDSSHQMLHHAQSHAANQPHNKNKRHTTTSKLPHSQSMSRTKNPS